jgi:hypothetical protein
MPILEGFKIRRPCGERFSCRDGVPCLDRVWFGMLSMMLNIVEYYDNHWARTNKLASTLKLWWPPTNSNPRIKGLFSLYSKSKLSHETLQKIYLLEPKRNVCFKRGATLTTWWDHDWIFLRKRRPQETSLGKTVLSSGQSTRVECHVWIMFILGCCP